MFLAPWTRSLNYKPELTTPKSRHAEQPTLAEISRSSKDSEFGQQSAPVYYFSVV